MALNPISVLVVALLAASTASAQEPPVSSQDPNAETKAREYIELGQAYFDALDYENAIEMWTHALAAIPDTTDYHSTRLTILFMIANARLDAYESDRQLSHLHHARRLLETCHEGFEGAEAGSRAKAQELLTKIDEKIAAATPVQQTAPTQQPPNARQPSDQPESGSPQRPPGWKWITSGLVLTGVGIGLTGVGVGYGVVASRHNTTLEQVFDGNPDSLTYDQSSQVFQDGLAAERAQIIFLTVGGGVAVTGLSLIIAGVAKRRKSSRARLSLTPLVSPHAGSLWFRGEF